MLPEFHVLEHIPIPFLFLRMSVIFYISMAKYFSVFRTGFEIDSIFTRQLFSASDALVDANPYYGPETPFVERMALLARLEGEGRGHEICCVATVKE